MDRIDVSPSQLLATATELETQAELLTESIQDLASAADTLRLQWEGEAQEAFDDRQTEFRLRMERRRESLEGIASTLREAGDAYGATDRACARALGGQ